MRWWWGQWLQFNGRWRDFGLAASAAPTAASATAPTAAASSASGAVLSDDLGADHVR